MVMSVRMAQLPEQERPRERLMVRGPGALSDRELIAILLRTGGRGANAVDLAGVLIAEFGGLRQLAAARPEELSGRAGVGSAKAAAVVAAFELGRRVSGATDEPAVLRTAADVGRIAMAELGALRRERLLVLICDSSNRLRQAVMVSEGSIDKALVPVREILNAVLRHDGRSFALAHNHPGGDPTASPADLRATAEVRAAAGVVGLRFLGHVVVTSTDWQEVK